MPNWTRDPWNIKTEELRHFATIQNNQPIVTGTRGESVPKWVDVYKNEPVAIHPLGGRELELARQMVPNASHQIRMRYKPDIAVVMWRVVYEGVAYYIANVN